MFTSPLPNTSFPNDAYAVLDASAMSGEHVHFCTYTSSTRSDVHHLFKKHTWSSASSFFALRLTS